MRNQSLISIDSVYVKNLCYKLLKKKKKKRPNYYSIFVSFTHKILTSLLFNFYLKKLFY